MSWLRLDDGFTKHPKFEGWTPAQRWSWLEVMEYCARYETRGRVPDDLSLLPRSVTAKLLKLAEHVGWCARGEDGALWINDWDIYNPPRLGEGELEQRVASAIVQHPGASANELVKLVGGRRREALAAIRKALGSPPGSAGGSGNHSGTGTHVGKPARPRPVPSIDRSKQAADTPADAAELNRLLDELHIDKPLRYAAHQDIARAVACAVKALAEAKHNPGGYFRRLLESGDWPVEAEPRSRPWSELDGIKAMIANGAIGDRLALELEIEHHEFTEGEAAELRSLIPHTEEALT